MIRYSVRYGSADLHFNLPDRWKCRQLRPARMPDLDDEKHALCEAFNDPIGSRPLPDILSGGKDLVIVVSDKTRVTGAEIFLPLLLNTANEAGIPDDKITVLFACGTHSGQSDEDRKRVAGPETTGRVRLLDHDPARSDLVNLGTTEAGTPVLVNRIAREADRLVVTGTILMHYFAGFGGGRKGVVPGICGEETIIRNHSFTVNPEGGRNPLCRTAVLDGNPLHEDMMEAAGMIAPDFLLNTVMNDNRRIAAVFAGDWKEAHRKGCDYVKARECVKIDRKAEVVIVSAGGYPKDINYIQAHKSYDNAFRAVEPGGTIILAAECRDGLGNDIIREFLAIEDIREHEERLRTRFQISGHTALAHKMKASSVRTIMITGMSDRDFGLLGIERACDLDEAVHMTGRDTAEICFMPEGPVTLPCSPIL